MSLAQGTGRVTDGVVAVYGFEEGAGTTITDVSGVGTPLNLTIADPNAVSWLPGGGLMMTAPTLIASPGPGTKLIDAVQATDALTLEAWITPANTTQTGPARIVTLSDNPSSRNVTLGQSASGGAHHDVRLRSTSTTNNGMPSLSTASGTLVADLTHVVYTRDATGATRIYVDGVLTAQGTTAGTLSDWNSAHRFALGN
ncbi:MAG: LamG domain-containing protein, partial [Proteobacteria bacterium]|nr:LamG domain-containing protein [Pseudomonadota bacterium]